MEEAIFWFTLNIVTIVFLAFYSMSEMACVSFNKARLHYYTQLGMKRATWLNELLRNPTMLFGTTLLGVNVATFVGSECAREFHSAIGINPDLAPISQVILVVIFGELAPMFAARHYAEHVAMLTVPLVYASSKLMTPVLWAIRMISKVSNWLTGGKESRPEIFLSQEELQKMFGDDEEESGKSESKEFNTISSNIFALEAKTAAMVMTPMSELTCLPSDATIVQMKNLMRKKPDIMAVPIYHRTPTNIVGIAFPHDLLKVPPTKRIRDYSRAPWFITQTTHAVQILKQFRTNSQSVGVVLNEHGQAVGMLSLDDIFEEIFVEPRKSKRKMKIVDRTIAASMTVEEFQKEFGTLLDERKDLTLSELIIETLGHHPSAEESIYIEPFDLVVKDTALLEVKTVKVSTRLRRTLF